MEEMAFVTGLAGWLELCSLPSLYSSVPYTRLLWGFSPSPHICTFPPFHQESSYKVLRDLNTVKLKGIPSCQLVPSVSMRSAVGHCVGTRHLPPSLLHVSSSSTMYQRDPRPQTQAFSFCHPHSSLRWSSLKQMNFISS